MMCPLCCAVRELCPDVLEQRTADVRRAYSNWRQGPAESRRPILFKSLGSEDFRFMRTCTCRPSCKSHPYDLAERQEFCGVLKREGGDRVGDDEILDTLMDESTQTPTFRTPTNMSRTPSAVGQSGPVSRVSLLHVLGKNV